MSGNLTLEELGALSASGEIDTVLACIVDMQGRLMGKRFVAPAPGRTPMKKP